MFEAFLHAPAVTALNEFCFPKTIFNDVSRIMSSHVVYSESSVVGGALKAWYWFRDVFKITALNVEN